MENTSQQSLPQEEDPTTFNKIKDLITQKSIEHFIMTHDPVLTSKQAADIRGVSLASGAKAMLLKDNSKNIPDDKLFYLAVMSASKKFSWKLIKKILKIKNMRFATPEEVFQVTRCLPGAVPPFGSVFGVPTLVDESLKAQGDTINFNCGLRTHSMRLKVQDYLNIEQPKLVGVFTEEGEDEKYVETPTYIPLKFKGIEFKAKSVQCGPNFTFVIGQTKQTPAFFKFDKNELEILDQLRQILLKKGSLAGFFGLIGKHNKKGNKFGDPQNIRGQMHQFFQDDSDDGEVLKTEESENLYIPRNVFVEFIEQSQFTQKRNSIQQLADKLIEEERAQGDNIRLADIEDYAIGFRQSQIKVFAFGQGHKKIFAFQRKPQEKFDSDEDNSSDSSIEEHERRQMHLQKQYQNEIIVVARPTVIKFPKFTKPITSLSCGSAHILAVTEGQELYSWGVGSYGALGFGTRDDVWEPKLLQILKDNQEHQIIGASCGKYHSIIITKKKNIYSWGCGQGGRLGHGNEEDVLVPREILGIQRGKPIFISAGESHSACITDRLCLYTWGCGHYGRLGHGLDLTEKRPKLVEDLESFEVTHVSCGPFHTLVVAGQGMVFAFGQGKYGKLGINKKDNQGVFMIPEKINFYTPNFDQEEEGDLLQDKNDAIMVASGYNHSIALTKSGKVYSWGYNGKGVLGRQPSGFYAYLPIEIGNGPGNFVAKTPNTEDMIHRGEQKPEDLFSFEITQVACGSLNTVSLTNGGEIYVIGSNAYGQLCKNVDDNNIKKDKRALYANPQENQANDLQETISLIKFPGNNVRICYIACGGEHIFAISRTYELYGWGRNEEGQLGIGVISEYANEPQLIKKLVHKHIVMVACGDNYTAALSLFGECYVTGNMEDGKLGLGEACTHGYLLKFKRIRGINPIKYVTCGPSHMLAISDYSQEDGENKDGKTYSWGRNNRGQLGIGNKEDQSEPIKIIAKERFRKVVAGQNFSLGLSTTNQVYFWGNYRYFCEKGSKDYEEPQILKFFEGKQIKDIACQQYYCLVLNDKGEIFQWGKYLKEKNDKSVDRAKSDFKSINKFPNTSKFDVLMETIITGPNHSAAVSVKKSLYTWGHFTGGRLGIKKEEAKKALIEPIMVQYIMGLLQQNKQNQKEGRGDDDDDIKGPDKKKKDLMNEETKLADQGNMEEQKREDGKEERKGNKDEKKKGKEEKKEEKEIIDDDNLGEIEDIEAVVPHEEYIPQEKPKLISLAGSQSMIEIHIKLQKILKRERQDGYDEDSIIKYDNKVLKEIQELLQKFKQYQKLEQQRKNMLVQMQSSFLQRISDIPFNQQVLPENRLKGINPAIVKIKKDLKNITTILHIHPCYMIKMYQRKLLTTSEYGQLIKEIYSYQNDRVNYLLMAILSKITDQELCQYQTIEEVNFLSQESVVGKIFKYIFKSQETNIDTLCSIGSHVLNKLLNKFQSSGTTNQDNSYDVTDKLAKSSKFDQQADKPNKNQILSQRANDLFAFVEEIIKEIQDNDILYPQGSYFIAKKQYIEEYIKKKQNNQDKQDNQPEKPPSIRFSQEIAYLAESLQEKIRNTKFKMVPLEDVIISKILSLIFGYLEKIWKNHDIYLYPYIKSAKSLSIVEDLINKNHKNNLDNIFHVINCFFRGEQVFPEYSSESWNKELTLKLNHLQQSIKGPILQRIIDKNTVKQISFKNFENLILHSLDSEGHTISIRKKTLHKACQVLLDNQDDLTIVRPATEDPLFAVLLPIKDDIKALSKGPKDDKMNFKLKSRLLIEELNPVVSRCGNCNSILVQKFAPPDSMVILEKYVPEDSQSLVVQYCIILKTLSDITDADSNSIVEYIEKVHKNAQTQQQYELANKLSKFDKQVKLELESILNRIVDDQAMQDNDEAKIKEQIYIDIQKSAETKINERRQRQYDLSDKKIQAKVKQIENKEFMLYQMTTFNIQYGLANQELKHLADAYTLKHMRKIIDYTTSAQMSKPLYKNLRNEQKLSLRSIVKKSAKSLIKSQTITDVVLPQLKPLINKCELVFLEGQDSSITVKLIFRETSFSLCGPPRNESEAVLLNFTISQKELLEMRKQGKAMESTRFILANAIEFDHSKLMKIFNEMDRSKSAYILNSGATPQLLQKSKQENQI